MQLGFNDMYHMMSVFINGDADRDKWVEAYKGKFTSEREPYTRAEWDELLGKAQACADLPSAPFSVELAALYPEAKVVILNRDPEKWYQSVLDTVYPAMNPSGFLNAVCMMYGWVFDKSIRSQLRFRHAVNDSMPFDHRDERDKAISWFKDEYRRFREEIPKERYIEFKVQDGWKPLCEHLEVPVPMVKDEKTGEMVEAPFPRVNDTASFQKAVMVGRMKRLEKANHNFFAFVGRAAVTVALGYGGYLVWKARLGHRS